jgi:hypothetical protein
MSENRDKRERVEIHEALLLLQRQQGFIDLHAEPATLITVSVAAQQG